MAERRTRTPAEMATEALAVHDRKLKRVKEKVDALKKDLAPLEQELAYLQRRREFLASDPELPANKPKTETVTAQGAPDPKKTVTPRG